MGAEERFITLNRRRPALGMRLLERVGRGLQYGSLEIAWPDRPAMLFAGTREGPHARLEIREPRFLRRLLFRGDLGFAEAWMAGEWDTPDLTALLECLALNQEAIGGLQHRYSVLRWLQWLNHALGRRNSRRGSRRNIARHYDLGNDFYRLWLDESLTYSGAHFDRDVTGLTQAQQRKYANMLDMLGAGEGDHILEIGCGWGGFAIHAARERNCRVTGVTVSREQLRLARQRAEEAGVSDRVHFLFQDYRDIEGQFDFIASIEMFEAVGEQYWNSFFTTLRNRLRPGGRAALQTITIDDAVFAEYRRRPDFIQTYIFPGGVLASPAVFREHVRDAGLETRKWQSRGQDYARTLACWQDRFSEVEPAVRKQGFDEAFVRMWHYYLAYCRAGFRTGRIDLLNTLLVRAN